MTRHDLDTVVIEVAIQQEDRDLHAGVWCWYRDDAHWASGRFYSGRPDAVNAHVWQAAAEAIRAHPGTRITFVSNDDSLLGELSTNTRISDRGKLIRPQYGLASTDVQARLSGVGGVPENALKAALHTLKTGYYGPEAAWSHSGTAADGTTVLFTDGCRLRTGKAGWSYVNGATQRTGKAYGASSLECEMLAIRYAIEDNPNGEIVVVTDNKDAIRTAKGRPLKGGAFAQAVAGRLAKIYAENQHRVRLVHVFGHAGVPGNSRADRLARHAAKAA